MRGTHRHLQFVLGVLLTASCLHAAPQLRAGVSRVKITPSLPVWLAGYAARTHPANSVAIDLYAKGLALDDGDGGRVVIVTTDIIGLPHEVSDSVAQRVEDRFKLKRSQLVLNSSHTHTGPVIWPNLKVTLDLTDADQKASRDYAALLADLLVQVTGDALQALVPVQISYGQGDAGFAINRRAAQLKKLNPDKEFPAPVDHSVPVLRVQRRDGTLLAVLFGYACHNTTMTAQFYEVGSDYAGFAQAAIEHAHPGATALFLMLCGADQNPDPRGTRELAMKFGDDLAHSVERVLTGSMRKLGGPVNAAYQAIDLPFAPHTREQFSAESTNADVFRQRRARLMLQTYDGGAPIKSIPYPVQAVRVGPLALVTLGGEVVVDFALRLKHEYPDTPLIVAGYSNDVMSYVPSERVLNEGGYEGGDAMIYYGLPGPYAAGVEERIVGAVHTVLRAVRIKP